MSVVKNSSLTDRIDRLFGSNSIERVTSGMFDATSVLGCPRRAVVGHSLPKIHNILPEYRYKLHSCEFVNVVNENVSLSDSETSLCGFIDMVVEISGVMVLIKLYEERVDSEAPLTRHVTDMVTCMYLGSVYTGVIVYCDNGIVKCHFVNPDRIDALKIVKKMVSQSKRLREHVISGTYPDGIPNSGCPLCPHRESCVNRREAGETGESGKERKDD